LPLRLVYSSGKPGSGRHNLIGDTATPGGGTWPWWYHIDDETERNWKEDPQNWYEGYFVGGKKNVEEI
jgi:alpha-galactosidase